MMSRHITQRNQVPVLAGYNMILSQRIMINYHIIANQNLGTVVWILMKRNCRTGLLQLVAAMANNCPEVKGQLRRRMSGQKLLKRIAKLLPWQEVLLAKLQRLMFLTMAVMKWCLKIAEPVICGLALLWVIGVTVVPRIDPASPAKVI